MYDTRAKNLGNIVYSLLYKKGGGGILGFQTGASEVSEGEIFSEILVGDKKQGFNVLWKFSGGNVSSLVNFF